VLSRQAERMLLQYLTSCMMQIVHMSVQQYCAVDVEPLEDFREVSASTVLHTSCCMLLLKIVYTTLSYDFQHQELQAL
jgi:hypothetical protein